MGNVLKNGNRKMTDRTAKQMSGDEQVIAGCSSGRNHSANERPFVKTDQEQGGRRRSSVSRMITVFKCQAD